MLKMKGSADEISQALTSLGRSEVEDWVESIVSLLSHRFVIVRYSAAAALGKAGIGAEHLREALKKEKNDLVVAEICDSLAAIGDVASEDVLRQVSRESPSSLARTYANLALSEILGRCSIDFLYDRYSKEKSRRVRSASSSILFILGEDSMFDSTVRHLESRDYLVRCQVANLLAATPPKDRSGRLLAALKDRFSREETVAARSSLQKAIEALSA